MPMPIEENARLEHESFAFIRATRVQGQRLLARDVEEQTKRSE
jgi:hypothetical protein